jgi:hypothetical protein
MAQRLVRLAEQLGFPSEQLLPEIFQLHRIHEGLFFGRSIVGRKQRFHAVLDWIRRFPETMVSQGDSLGAGRGE